MSAPLSGWIDNLPLPPGPPVIGVGAHFHTTVCVAGGDSARLSPPLADLDTADRLTQHQHWVQESLEALNMQVGHSPARTPALAHDLHPDFPSTLTAQWFAQSASLRCVPVQHHHAHLAAVWAEHAPQASSPALLGLALDGFGLGTDGQAWGGELLHLTGAHAHRIGHLRPLPMPGGDACAREPWRLAVAALHSLGLIQAAQAHAQAHAPAGLAAPLLQWLAHPLRCPPTTSLGRLFDATASLLGLCHIQRHQAEAAQALEAAAQAWGDHPPHPGGWQRCSLDSGGEQLDFLPLLAHLTTCSDPAQAAACFHATLVDGLSSWLIRHAAALHIDTVALGGGCLYNAWLRHRLTDSLQQAGLRVWLPQRLSPGDPAIAYGQAVVARLILAYH